MAALGGVGGQKDYFAFHQQKQKLESESQPTSIRLPFPLRSPDRTPSVPYVLAFMFDVIEVSGLRMIVGFVLGWYVRVVRLCVGSFVKLD